MRVEPTNQRIAPIEGTVPEREEDPYGPLGIRFGRFIVTSSVEQGLTWTSNADSSPGGAGATQSETTLRLSALSDWSRHAATMEAYGRFLKTLSGDE